MPINIGSSINGMADRILNQPAINFLFTNTIAATLIIVIAVLIIVFIVTYSYAEYEEENQMKLFLKAGFYSFLATAAILFTNNYQIRQSYKSNILVPSKPPPGINFTGSGNFKTFELNIQEPWLTHIREGRKTAEVRIDRPPFSSIVTGDRLEFAPKLYRRVISAKKYASLEELFAEEEIEKILPGFSDTESAISIYRNYITEQDEENCGVILFKFEE